MRFRCSQVSCIRDLRHMLNHLVWVQDIGVFFRHSFPGVDSPPGDSVKR